MRILAIETSCDDTAAAVLNNGTVLSNIISSQDIHTDWGGIVPELASREHVKAIGVIVAQALRQADSDMDSIDAIAVTSGPGLPGSLLVGTQFAKGLALRFNKPLYPVHHIEAHIYSGYLENPDLTFPSITLVVSGGHTGLFLVRSAIEFDLIGTTLDDAAGEAFDKIAKMLGLQYPGGPAIDKLAKNGKADAIAFPRGLINQESFDFSFSGLKTSVKRYLQQHPQERIEDIAASAQHAIVDVLVAKTLRAATANNINAVTIAGGVAANSELNRRMRQTCNDRRWTLVSPRSAYCMDNAAMIGFLAALRMRNNVQPTVDFRISPASIRRKATH
ncbi:MAG: tRNA (adenosine(37)-N6)-threonylcarbamoyltransferase complex transferase subunit TsaD [Ignavibacteria bacterium]|nr:tRNA (adenosine(37)-N6)-threonylcarbamoyltransferase complex transferase subunit TsaD [Ignavibacteria bacterium]